MTMILKPHSTVRSVSSLVLVLASTAASADGPFDPTFAGGGLFPYSYWFGDDVASTSGIARDSLGRLVVATTVGYHSTGRSGLGVTRHIAIKIENETSIFPFSDGFPDSLFGTDGVASGFLGTDNDSYAAAIAVDHHDRIIVGGDAEGTVACADGTTDAISADTVVRLRNDSGFDGQADLTFGTFGVAIYGDCTHYTNGIAALAVDKDDNIVATGSIREDSHYASSVIRWNSSGLLDTSFGTAGVASDAFMGDSTIGTAVAIDSAGRILVAGQATIDDGTVIGLLMRYTPGGKLDTTFGSGGFTQLGTIGANRLGYLGYVCCLKIDSQNRAFVAGSIVTASPLGSEASEQFSFVARFTDKGLPDNTFGQHGFVYPSVDRMTEVNALAIDNRDRPVIGGSINSSYYPRAVSGLTHFNKDGSVNAALGFGGTYTGAFGFSSSYVTSLMIDPLGRPTMTAVGYDTDTKSVPVLIRYDELFGDGFD